MTKRRVGVVLFQLGGPDTLAAVEPFLYNLFCDPDIIDFPFAKLGRKPLAKLISSTRAKRVQHHYEVIGGGSPLRKFTEMQAIALQRLLRAQHVDATCVVAMRYWHPFTDEAIEQLQAADVDELVLLPLYPQYSSTTTGSSLNEWNRHAHKLDRLPTHTVSAFYANPAYLDAFIEKIEAALARFEARERPTIVFSAHSLPIAVVDKGDPYQRQIEETVSLLRARAGWRNPWRLCYQSKVGASKWLQPTLRGTLRELAAQGEKELCIVPVAFVSDHVETLGEIDHEGREQAHELGFTRFEMTAGLNDSPKFIAALAELVLSALAATRRSAEEPQLVAAD
jgi:protoporphyrin/coproporphyrin ferrochelatase